MANADRASIDGGHSRELDCISCFSVCRHVILIAGGRTPSPIKNQAGTPTAGSRSIHRAKTIAAHARTNPPRTSTP